MADKSTHRSAAQISADLERTRAEMTRTVDELVGRLDPRVSVKNAAAIGKRKAVHFLEQVKAGNTKARIILGAVVGMVALTLVAKIRTRGQ